MRKTSLHLTAITNTRAELSEGTVQILHREVQNPQTLTPKQFQLRGSRLATVQTFDVELLPHRFDSRHLQDLNARPGSPGLAYFPFVLPNTKRSMWLGCPGTPS